MRHHLAVAPAADELGSDHGLEVPELVLDLDEVLLARQDQNNIVPVEMDPLFFRLARELAKRCHRKRPVFMGHAAEELEQECRRARST